MFRILLLVVVVWLLFKVFTRSRSSAGEHKAGEGMRGSGIMRRCDYCDVFVPGDESIRDGERYFCSEQHRQASLNGPEDPKCGN
jgi:uncharacterized protein